MARLKWTSVEKDALLRFMISEIENGGKISKSLEKFADVFNVPVGAVKSQWQHVAHENRLAVEIAKNHWRTVEKPKRIEQEKMKKRSEKIAEKNRKHREMLIIQRKKSRKQKRVVHTGMKPDTHEGVKYIVDSNGLVVRVLN